MPYPRVLLATCAAIPELTDDDRPLIGELFKLGIKAEPAVWDDPKIDWKAADLVLIRSTWDYHLRAASFAAWIERLASSGAKLWNPPAVVRVNSDKNYLRALEASGVSVVPTEWVAKGTKAELRSLMAARGWRSGVVKPCVSGGAFLTAKVAADEPGGQKALDEVLGRCDAMIQPFLAEIAAEGEWSFVFLGGEFSHAVLKTPARGDFRVQEEHGGSTRRAEPPPELLAQARDAATAAPGPWLYARVDGVDRGGELVVIELELIEPHLYLSHSPGAAAMLAKAVSARISADRPSPTRS